MRTRLWYAGLAGLVIGVTAAASQAFFRVQPPVAYGFCMVCHPATMVAWAMNTYFKTNLPISQAFLVFPSLLAVGVVVGAVIAANANGEISWRRAPGRKKYMSLLFGFLIANMALITAGCPIRLGLLVSYGSISGLVLVASLVLGIGLACVYLKFRKESSK
jgi:hypothetical protein